MTGALLAVLLTIGSERSTCPQNEQTVLKKLPSGVYVEVPRPTGCQWIYEEREEEWTEMPERGGQFTRETKPRVVKPRPPRPDDPVDNGR